MKTVLAFVLFGALAVYSAMSETCSESYPCTETTCTAGNVECVDIMSVRLCTCMHSHEHDTHCAQKTDCDQFTTFTQSCNQTKRHCVDSVCRCEGFGHNHHGHGNGLHFGGN